MKYENVISTGFQSLDEVLGGGFHSGSFSIIAARPGIGKTTFAMQCAAGMIKNTEKKIYILSLEMDSEHIKKKYSDLSEDNRIIIDDTALITHSQLCANLNGIPDLGAVIIDYFQLINTDSRVCGQKEIVRELKQIATELDIPVICTSQFPSITEEQRKNYRLVLSNLIDIAVDMYRMQM